MGHRRADLHRQAAPGRGADPARRADRGGLLRAHRARRSRDDHPRRPGEPAGAGGGAPSARPRPADRRSVRGVPGPGAAGRSRRLAGDASAGLERGCGGAALHHRPHADGARDRCRAGIAARHRNGIIDYLARFFSLTGLSFPAFVSAILLLLAFTIELRWFPVISEARSGNPTEQLRALALPAINLGLIMVAYVMRVARSSMLGVLGEDYIRTARAKGVPARVVIWRHALRNALIPVVTVVGLYLGVLIGNSVLTEIVFNRPGLGKLIINALNQRDYTLLEGMMVIYAFFIVIANLLTDLTYGLIDPRVKHP